MKTNNKDKVSQPVYNKKDQPLVKDSKAADTNHKEPKAIQDNQYGEKQKHAILPSSKKI